jgi:two-component system heavy metal sensor histidine kinase CusS
MSIFGCHRSESFLTVPQVGRPSLCEKCGLVSNAVARTPPGGSVVLAANAEGATICIEVTDTGVGIPPEALPRVFDRFFRVDASRSQASGGTGLGLAIVHGIMLLHGGNAEIVSRPGQGTRVSLRMPVSGAG